MPWKECSIMDLTNFLTTRSHLESRFSEHFTAMRSLTGPLRDLY